MRTVISSENTSTVFITGRFCFETRIDFNNAFNATLNSKGGKIIIDLSGTSDVDASALGMLLMAKDKAAQVNKTLVLANATERVKNILLLAKFDTRMEMI